MIDSTRTIVVIPFVPALCGHVIGQMRYLRETGFGKDCVALLAADLGTKPSDIYRVMKAAKLAFPEVQVVQPPFPYQEESGLSRENWLVSSAVMRVCGNPKQMMAVLPANSAPVHPEWVKLLRKSSHKESLPTLRPHAEQVSGWLGITSNGEAWFDRRKTSHGAKRQDEFFKLEVLHGDGVGVVFGPGVALMFSRLGEKTETPKRKTVRIRRWWAIGDVIASTAIVKRFHELGYDVEMVSHETTCEVLLHHPHLKLSESSGRHDVDLDLTYETHPQIASKHIGQIFLEKTQEQLPTVKLGKHINLAPELSVTSLELAQAKAMMEPHARPWNLVCPRSNMLSRSVQPPVWAKVKAQGTLFWTGFDEAPPGYVDLRVRKIRLLMACAAAADLVISVDSAPLHIAAALKKPIVAIQQAYDPALRISDQRDMTTIRRADLPCISCSKYACPIDVEKPPCADINPQIITDAIAKKQAGIFAQTVSAVIPTYRPNMERLNKCLKAVLPQVDEAVVVVDGDGYMPKGLMADPKIKVVRHSVIGQKGYGRSNNLGARESFGRHLLFLNDDCFLLPGAVAAMKAQLVENPKVAVVGCRLHYPDGKIQHGGTFRSGMNYGHLDLLKTTPSITEPVEMEFVTFASAMVRRTAFYEVDAFDEGYFAYCDDSDLCLRVRQRGWKVIYEPRAAGIHEESQTTAGKKNEYGAESNARFNDRWGWYFKENQGNSGLGTFQHRPPATNTITLHRRAAFGDVIQASVVADHLKERGYRVKLSTEKVIRHIFDNHPSVDDVGEFKADADLDDAYESQPRSKGIQEWFFESAKRQLLSVGIDMGRYWERVPRLVATPEAIERARKLMEPYPKPWVVITPSSYKNGPKHVPEHIWKRAAISVRGTCFNAGVMPFQAPFVNLQSETFGDLLGFLKLADVVATVDTGPMHAAAALRKPIVAIQQAFPLNKLLNDLADYISVGADLDCLGCSKHECPINADAPPCQNVSNAKLSGAINQKLSTLSNGLVSAVVAVYKPNQERITRCLNAVMGQVHEVVLSCDAGCSTESFNGGNVRTLLAQPERTGYGRTATRGVRQTVGEWILFLNDDCYLAPGAVAKMMEAVRPDVAIVGCLTRYPDGTIYHGGTVTSADGMNFGHLDWGKREPSVKTVTEMQFMNLAAGLVRRSAFYEVGGYDARFDCYSEDQDLCLKIRRAGWKIVYQPAAEGIHEEGKSTMEMKDRMNHESKQLFAEKWRAG